MAEEAQRPFGPNAGLLHSATLRPPLPNALVALQTFVGRTRRAPASCIAPSGQGANMACRVCSVAVSVAGRSAPSRLAGHRDRQRARKVPALYLRPGRQERPRPGPAALPLRRLQQDLQRHDGHAAGRAASQGTVLSAGRLPGQGHDRARGGRVSEGVYHVQTVNNYHERLKTWTNRQLRGVATKYLDNYLAWMRMREWFKEGVKPEHFIVSGLGQQIINR